MSFQPEKFKHDVYDVFLGTFFCVFFSMDRFFGDIVLHDMGGKKMRSPFFYRGSAQHGEKTT